MAAATLAQALAHAMVDPDKINREYKALVAIVRELIGVIPNCNPVLEIWPPGFRTFNVLIPNLLNLPPALVGQGAPKDLVGLAMFISSRESGCAYCTAHHCSFAIRRGASYETVIDGDYSPQEAAVVELARSIATLPSELTKEKIDAVAEFLPPDEIEWVVLAIALGGFLNKFMDAMGIELEDETIRDVTPLIGDQGWSPGKHQWLDELPDAESNGGIPTDNYKTILNVMRRAPGALKYDAASTRGVSGRVGSTLMMLEDRIGYAFPILAGLGHKKAVRAIATALRDNLDPELSEIGMGAKCMVALVYAKSINNEVLVAEAVQLAGGLVPDLDQDTLVAVSHFATSPPETAVVPEGLTSAEVAAIILAKAASASPSDINEFTISTITEQLTPAQIVEIVLWLAVLQMLHRLYGFYDANVGLV